MGKFTQFARIAETEFSDIVISSYDFGHKLRIYLRDKSFIDFFYTTQTNTHRFSIHWERIHIDNTIYRIDNMPDPKWEEIDTYPIHFHKGNYNTVEESPFDTNLSLEELLRSFLSFARKKI